MMLEYNIVWIDDEISSYEERNYLDIKMFLQDLGYKPTIYKIEGLKNAQGIEHDYRCDLIVSDYNIDEDVNGIDIIKELRNKQIHSEVLLYSGKRIFENESISKSILGIHRVTVCDRDELKDRLREIIALTNSRYSQLNSVRGLIVAETSTFDARIQNLIQRYCSMFKTKKEELIMKGIKKYILGKAKERLNEAEKMNVDSFENHIYNLEAATAVKLLIYFLNDDQLFKEHQLGGYIQEIIEPRNKFAHGKEETKEGKKVLISRKNEDEFNDDVAAKYRKVLVKYRELIENIENVLVTKSQN